MVRHVVTTTQFTDDLTGGKAENTVRFSVGGVAYEIDLSKANRRAFEKALKPYLDTARTVRGSAGRVSRRSTPTTATHDLGAIRAWARSNGYHVADRGRLATSVIDAYRAANT